MKNKTKKLLFLICVFALVYFLTAGFMICLLFHNRSYYEKLLADTREQHARDIETMNVNFTRIIDRIKSGTASSVNAVPSDDVAIPDEYLKKSSAFELRPIPDTMLSNDPNVLQKISLERQPKHYSKYMEIPDSVKVDNR